VIAAIVLSQGIFPPEVLNALNVEPLNLLAFILFFIFGFFLYAAMYAAMGSMVNSEQEAQSIQSLGILPLVVPMVFMQAMINDPLGRIATWLGMIPFTAPIAMPLRMASETIPLGQIAASLALLAAGMFAVTWVAGRIYRIGILSTGKKPNLAELMKWIKAA
jgi:ABC-2 type transport system permease protein